MCIEAAVWTVEGGSPKARHAATLAAPETPPGPAVAAFLSEVHARYPDLDQLSDEAQDASPWVVHSRTGPNHVLFSLEVEWWREVLPWLVATAWRHGLAFYGVNFDEHLPPQAGAPPTLKVAAFLEADAAGAARAMRWCGAGVAVALALLLFWLCRN